MSNLGNRLEKVISILESRGIHGAFADIGSDHAFLAIEVIKRGIATQAIASDINPLPLEKGRANASEQGAEVEFILSDGLDALEGRSISAAAICGMGGELIAKMILRSDLAHECLLVLQPMSAQEELRRTLWDNGFYIEEHFVVENQKPYTIITAVFNARKSNYDYIDLYLGKERSVTPEFCEYCKKVQAAAEKRRLGLVAKGLCTEEIDRLIDECQAHITKI